MSKSLPGLPEENQERSSQEDGSDSESDTESDDKATELQAEINDIQSDIEIKTKLIEQLELSQQRMMVMKQHYEDKLNVLSTKITNTQKERDQVLANIGRKLTVLLIYYDVLTKTFLSLLPTFCRVFRNTNS